MHGTARGPTRDGTPCGLAAGRAIGGAAAVRDGDLNRQIPTIVVEHGTE